MITGIRQPNQTKYSFFDLCVATTGAGASLLVSFFTTNSLFADIMAPVVGGTLSYGAARYVREKFEESEQRRRNSAPDLPTATPYVSLRNENRGPAITPAANRRLSSSNNTTTKAPTAPDFSTDPEKSNVTFPATNTIAIAQPVDEGYHPIPDGSVPIPVAEVDPSSIRRPKY